MQETHGSMAVGRVKHISPCLVGNQVGGRTVAALCALSVRCITYLITYTHPPKASEESFVEIAMHLIETLVEDSWTRSENFCPDGALPSTCISLRWS